MGASPWTLAFRSTPAGGRLRRRSGLSERGGWRSDRWGDGGGCCGGGRGDSCCQLRRGVKHARSEGDELVSGDGAGGQGGEKKDTEEAGKGPTAKGATTEPTLREKSIASDGEVSVEHYYRIGDHPPAHAHVNGGGPSTRIGPNGKPLAGQPELSSRQRAAVEANIAAIRRAINKIGKWLEYLDGK